MRIETKAATALTVTLLLNGYASIARADKGPMIPPAPTTLSGDPCGTSRTDQDVGCRVTASDRPITPSNFEGPNADPQRNEQPGEAPEASKAAKGALMGGLTVVAVILKLGPIGWGLCAIGGAYCVAAVLVGAVVGGAIAHIRRSA